MSDLCRCVGCAMTKVHAEYCNMHYRLVPPALKEVLSAYSKLSDTIFALSRDQVNEMYELIDEALKEILSGPNWNRKLRPHRYSSEAYAEHVEIHRR